MRTLTLAGIAILALSCIGVAQDVAPDAKKVDNAALLKSYLAASGDEKAQLKEKLLALATPDLRRAIAGIAFEAPEETGIGEFEIECPDGYERPYWVYAPEGYDETKSYPLLVCLHGGVSGWPLRGVQGRPPAGKSSIGYWAPLLPEDWQDEVLIMGCSAGARETQENAVWWAEEGQLNVLAMINDARRKFNIDDDRVIVNGHSDGGSGSFGFAFRMPDTWAGAFSMNGNPLVPTADGTPVWFENLKGQNIYCFNGGLDGLYPAERMTPLYKQANEVGAKIDFVVHEKLNHGVGPVLEDEVHKFLKGPLTDWRRDLLPTRIDWTTVDPDRGSRAWLSVTDIADLGDNNMAPPNAKIKLPDPPVRLGVQIRRNVEAPTVESVVAGSPAEKMGIKEGDVITKVDDVETTTLAELAEALKAKSFGDDVTVTVKRDGEAVELEGAFTRPQREEPEDAPLEARVIGEMTAPGQVKLTVRNVGEIAIRVAPSMLDEEGALRVRINPGDDGELALVLKQKFEPDNALILEQFEKTGDRKLPWIAEWTIDVSKALGVKVKPAKPDKSEDEF